MDGYGMPEDHVARAAELEMNAIAVTEHGNVSSHVKAEQAGALHGVKTIFGLEAYMAPRNMRETNNRRKWHQTILAMNEEGLNNLYQLVTRSWSEGFYQWPTIHWDMLQEHHRGLIVTSGCLDSALACSLLGGKGRARGSERDAIRTLRAYKQLLGDRFYLETQRFPELERARKLNPKYEEWSRRFGVPLVATSDVHYPMPGDNEMQKILHAAGRNIGTVAAAEAGWEYGILLTHPTSDAQILSQLRGTGLSASGARGAILSTEEIASRCNVTLPKMDRIRYPHEDEPNYIPGMTLRKMLETWLNDGWYRRGYHLKPRALQKAAKERAKYELDMFESKGYLDYFAMLSDTVRHCKDNGLPVGPARGSAAASFCCYLWRITEVDPLPYPLMLFERFVDPNRNDLPDVDLDFDDERRDEVRQYMISKYGEDRVGNIGTFTRYRGKNAVDDVARVYSIPEYEAKKIKEFLVERSSGDSRFDASIKDTVEMFPQVKEVFEAYPDFNKTIALEGNYKGFGVHAAGLVIGAEKLTDYVATYTRHNVGQNKVTMQVLSVDKYDGEYLGLMKLDALGLSTMGMIRHALEIIGMDLDDLYKIPLNDPETLAAFERADVIGIFQFEGRTMRMVTQELKPKTFMDLAAINALARPGPLHSGSTGEYLAIRHGHMERVDIHPLLTEICDETEGQIIYQEQILKICGDIGGLPWTHRAAIRRIISNKKGESAFNALWKDFLKGALERDVTEEVAREIWKRMVTAGTYAFNVAHCVSYSMLGFWAMWLKVHHPVAFYAASLRKASTDAKKRKDLALMRDAQDARFGRHYKIYPPQLGISGVTWSPAVDGVAAGYKQIPGIGDVMAQRIVDTEKEVGGFTEWADLVCVSGIGRKTADRIAEFAAEDDPFGIDRIKKDYANIVAAIEGGALMGCPKPNTTADGIPYEDKRSRHVLLALVKNRNLQDLFENYRSRTGEELDVNEVRDPELKDSMTLYLEDPTGLITVKVNRWMYPKIKNRLWDAELEHDWMLIEGEKKPYYGKTIHAKRIWVIDPED